MVEEGEEEGPTHHDIAIARECREESDADHNRVQGRVRKGGCRERKQERQDLIEAKNRRVDKCRSQN